MDTAAQCNGPDIDQVMQAAERCEGMFDVTSVDFENMPVAAAKDLYVMADYLRRILPKGKRPVPITGGMWGLEDGQPCQLEEWLSGKLTVRGRSMIYWGDRYETAEDARLAAHWAKIDKLIAFASSTET